MAKIISFGNFKGGTGKTTNSTMIAYELSKQGYKVLLADLDPQANATDLFTLTKKRQGDFSIEKTMMACLADGSFNGFLLEIKKNLYLLPSDDDFSSYPVFLESKFPNSNFYDRNRYFGEVLKEVEQEFDFILIDNPPSISVYTNSSLMVSHYIVIVLQTQERSLTGAEAFVDYLNEFVNQNELNLEIAGILPVLLKGDSIYDNSSFNSAKEIFGDENMFSNIVKNMERLKKYDAVGIIDPDLEPTNSDFHDKKVHMLYTNVAKELIARITDLEEE